MISEVNKNPVNKLMKTTILYFLGTFTSKALQFLIIPILTAVLMPEEYGYYDVVINTASVVIPIITLQVIDGMFRFLYKSTEEYATKLITNVAYFLVASICVLAIALVLLNIFTDSIKYPVLIFLFYSFFTVNSLFQKIARAKGQNRIFAYSGIIYTFFLLIIQCFFIKVLNLRVNGLLIANIIASIISTLYVIFKTRYDKYIKIMKIDWALIKEIILYSMPLVPNTLSWWAIGSINAYIVIGFLGIDANGILAIANKFPALVTMATSVFQLSWQETAISESGENNNSEFNSIIFNNYAKVIFLSAIVVLFLSKIFTKVMLGEGFISAWLYIPPILFAVVYSTLSSFLGAGYLASKKTRGAFTTTVFGAVINILIGLILIKSIGLFAPAIGNLIGFMVLMYIRIWDMKDYFRIKVKWKQFFLLNVLGIIAIFLYYRAEGIFLYSLVFISIIILLYFNKDIISKILRKIIKRI
jgi:O-antigen/teichoic acid export membrane protein